MRLSIEKSSFALYKGSLHALTAQDDRLTDTLLWRTLVDICTAGVRASLVSTSDAAASMALAGMQMEAGQAISEGSLQVLELQQSAQIPAQTSTLMMDLRHWQASSSSLLVIDGAQGLFPALKEDQLLPWRAWAQDNHQAVLFLFRSDSTAKSAHMTQLLPLAHHFAGLARIRAQMGEAIWENFHWFGPGGLLPPHTSSLSYAQDKRLTLSEKVEIASTSLTPAVDDAHVLAQHTVLQPGEAPAEGWQYIDADLDGMVLRTAQAVAATVILAYLPDTDFYRLSRAIFLLRKRNGSRLKIVVREVNARLRYGRERQAIKLGANLVVPAELSYSRFLTLTTMVESQIFTRKLPATFSEAMSGSSPTDEMGYLPPAEFAKTVTAMLTQSEAMNVQNALLRLPVAPGLQVLDALRYCRLNRPGDICTADHEHLYVFLNACRKADVSRVLSRSFGLPIDSLFSSEDHFHSGPRISAAVQTLTAQLQLAQLPDFSVDLFAPDASSAPSGAGAKASSQEVRGSSPEHFTPPPSAVPRPLRVKDAASIERRNADRRTGTSS